jgi:hypothetical protein
MVAAPSPEADTDARPRDDLAELTAALTALRSDLVASFRQPGSA